MPDIVGFRIIVLFPSDIDSVCAEVDQLVDSDRVYSFYFDATANAKSRVKTRWGCPREERGYYACHYYLRLQNDMRQPIVEVQIKTVLHDAWGYKTHDLTYKPHGRVDALVATHFNELGDSLARIDYQSDLLRQTINRSLRVRERKRQNVQLFALEQAAWWSCRDSSDALALFEKVKTVDKSNVNAVLELSRNITRLFDSGKRAACALAIFLALKTNRSVEKFSARDLLSSWDLEERDIYDQVLAKATSHIAMYAFSDAASAVDRAEEALSHLRANLHALSGKPNLQRLENSLLSSLGYYHAELVDSDVGRKLGSRGHAVKYAEDSLRVAKTIIGVSTSSSGTIIAAIEDLLPHVGTHEWLFDTLDNAIFVRIQCAEHVADVETLIGVLEALRKQRPPKGGPLDGGLAEYHLYCARSKLLDLEAEAS